MSKLEELRELKSKLEVEIKGKDNYPKDAPSVIISNHNRLMDIFYLPMAIDEDIVSVVSARLTYKQDVDRLKYLNKYLNAFPIEAHGGKCYSELCINQISSFLDNGISISIWPEGAYIYDTIHVYKGRTGASRILFNTLSKGNYAYFLPVSIDIKSDDDLDNFVPNINDKVSINICEPILPDEYYYSFINSDNKKDMNQVLHNITEEGMKQIASSLNREYVDEYIELFPKGNIIFSNGETVDKREAQKQEYINRYQHDLKRLALTLINNIKK